MLNLDLRHTQVYKEAFAEGKVEVKFEGKILGRIEGKLEIVSKLVEKGMSLQEIAQILDLDIEIVRKSLS
ncbi:MAG: hypothetical protein SAJ37_11275 [Oscillatoria sp. PMC 1068.18]|nr:hypothetical protein [Oscillatoria sp. PMC 1068.18]